jgi:uncharacterized protein (TIGR02466 family)
MVSETILQKASNFINMYFNVFKVSEKNIFLKDLWINFQKNHDFNPSHNHPGLISFVIYCKVPQNIFEDQAESKVPIAGTVTFEYGEDTSEFNQGSFTVKPFDGLMLMFPSEMRHYVSPYWIDEDRISVSGNIHNISEGR